jgi:hypothetical protein
VATAQLAPAIDRLIAELGITRGELATALDASERSVARWRAGQAYPQYESRARLEEMLALADRLQASFPGPAAVAGWLRAPSGSFGGLAPIDAMLRGRFDAVGKALDAREDRAG